MTSMLLLPFLKFLSSSNYYHTISPFSGFLIFQFPIIGVLFWVIKAAPTMTLQLKSASLKCSKILFNTYMYEFISLNMALSTCKTSHACPTTPTVQIISKSCVSTIKGVLPAKSEFVLQLTILESLQTD